MCDWLWTVSRRLLIVLLLLGTSFAQARSCGPYINDAITSTDISPQAHNILKAVIDSARASSPEYRDFYTHQPRRFFRGQTSRSYSAAHLFAFLTGDRRFEIRSWDYRRLYETAVGNGLSAGSAIKKADLSIARQIVRHIKQSSLDDYVLDQMLSTVATAPEELKKASAIPFSVNDHEQAEIYARMQYERARQTHPDALPLVWEITEGPAWHGLPLFKPTEYYVLSHVPIHAVTAVWIGLPSPPAHTGPTPIDWIEIRITQRSPEGAAEVLRVAALGLAPFFIRACQQASEQNSLPNDFKQVLASSPHGRQVLQALLHF